MDLIVSDAEFKDAAFQAEDAIDALVNLGNQFLNKLDKLASMGYKSEAMAQAIAYNRAIVESSLNLLSSASAPLSTNIDEFVRSIGGIDHI